MRNPFLNKLAGCLVLLLWAHVNPADDLDVARARMHKYLKESPVVGVVDQDLNPNYSRYYREYPVSIESGNTKSLFFELPQSDEVILFVSTSFKNEIPLLISVSEQSSVPRYLGGGNDTSSVKLRKTSGNNSAIIEVGIASLVDEPKKDGYIAVYAYRKEDLR